MGQFQNQAFRTVPEGEEEKPRRLLRLETGHRRGCGDVRSAKTCLNHRSTVAIRVPGFLDAIGNSCNSADNNFAIAANPEDLEVLSQGNGARDPWNL